MIKTLAVRLAEVKANKVCDTLDPVQAKALVNKLAATVAEIKAETVGKTLSSIESEALIHTLADTLLKWWWPRYLRRPCLVWSARQRSKQKEKAMPH